MDKGPNDGRCVGYCTRCGGDVFNPPKHRHRCPRKIHSHAFDVIRAAKQYRDARVALRCATLGTLNHARLEKEEAGKFEALVAAVAAVDEGGTLGET